MKNKEKCSIPLLMIFKIIKNIKKVTVTNNKFINILYLFAGLYKKLVNKIYKIEKISPYANEKKIDNN